MSISHSCINKNRGIKIPLYALEFLAAADILKMCKHNSYENSQLYTSKNNLICSLPIPIAEK